MHSAKAARPTTVITGESTAVFEQLGRQLDTTHTNPTATFQDIPIDDITVDKGRREVNAATVTNLARSIEQVGLRHPITVKRKGDGHLLIAGFHRLEAFRHMGLAHIPASIVTMTNEEARLWEIAENLHRAELTKLERDEQVAEWIRITATLSQSATVSGGRGNEGGVRAAARELGVDKDDAHRAVKVASISPLAKQAARDAGLDDNRTALLAVAKESTPEAQVVKVAAISTARAEARVANSGSYHLERVDFGKQAPAAVVVDGDPTGVKGFADFCRANSATTIVSRLTSAQAAAVQNDLGVIDEWLGRFAVLLDAKGGSA